ncbi:hypothetical protein DOD04_07750 [Klebsiella michiganensis]|nr:hypothetical protein [Klebsiella michiganensis]RXI19487.1 hypothetical protein DOD04_07750 [Klebsiella michiganensis]
MNPAVRRATATTTIPSRSKRKPAEALAAAGIKGVYPSYFKMHVRWLCYPACGLAPQGQRKRCSKHECLVLQLELFRV